MKRMFTTSTLVLALLAGTAAIAGNPDDQKKDAMEPTKAVAHHKSLKELLPEVKTPKLWVGSNAPELQIAKFVKGESVDHLAEGQVYVVEFWATWCGPCIAAFPHLSEMQADYGDKVRFIGVNVWEQKTGADRIEMVEDFVADQGERMDYTVAVEVDGKMSDTWLRPANQNGIPAAFIVGADGKIAWIGHPMSMEEPLKEVVSGKFDAAKAAEQAMEGELIQAGFMKLQGLMKSGSDFKLANDISVALINDHFSDEPRGLNAVAWMLLTSEHEDTTNRLKMTAHKAAMLACEATDWKDWSILDTYALACNAVGNPREAAKWQQKAIDLMPDDEPDARAELEDRLDEYKAAIED
ncbi:MAG: TlpA family protein disulfide reductase [Phycisphaerales bacterium]|nr:TlpA family protein disulfide reductase [Phycisphaerales bacterium]